MKPEGIERVLVVGAGVMGHGIAQVFSQAGPGSQPGGS